MHRKFNPPTIRTPGAYMHGVESAPGLRWLHVAGQVGIDPQGNLPSDFPSQVEIAMDNLIEVLKHGGMGIEDIVRMTMYFLSRDDLPAFRAARERKFGDVLYASTILIVSGLARPEFKVEIECIAARE